MKWLLIWVFSQIAHGSVAPVSVQIASASHQQTEYLILLFTNEPGWHTYYKHPGEVGLPFQFYFKRHGTTISMVLTGWPLPDIFIDPSGFTSKGYTGQYAFFFFLPQGSPPMKEGETLHIEAKWLACGNRCLPQKAVMQVLWQQGKWIPIEKAREITLQPQQVVQFFSAQEADGAEIIGPVSEKRALVAPFWWLLIAIGGLGTFFGWRRFRPSFKQ